MRRIYSKQAPARAPELHRDAMTATRTYGLVIIILGAILLWFSVTGTLLPAPLIMVFGTLGAIGAVGLGVWALLGKI